MRLRLFAVLALSAAALMLAAGALAASHALKGGIKKDEDGLVSMTIVMKNGKPKTAKNVKVKNFDYTCEGGGSGEQDLDFGNASIAKDDSGHFSFEKMVFESGGRPGESEFRGGIGGVVSKSGKMASGETSYGFFDADQNFCESVAPNRLDADNFVAK